jgi:hypothetical protein
VSSETTNASSHRRSPPWRMSLYRTSSRHYTVFPLTQSIQARPLQDSKACRAKMECRIADFESESTNPEAQRWKSGVRTANCGFRIADLKAENPKLRAWNYTFRFLPIILSLLQSAFRISHFTIAASLSFLRISHFTIAASLSFPFLLTALRGFQFEIRNANFAIVDPPLVC